MVAYGVMPIDLLVAYNFYKANVKFTQKPFVAYALEAVTYGFRTIFLH